MANESAVDDAAIPLAVGAVLLGFMFAGQMLYGAYGEQINMGAVQVAAYMLYPFAYLSDEAYQVLKKLAEVPASRWRFDQIVAVFKIVASYWRWPVIAMFLGLVVWLYAARGIDRYRRHLSAMALLEEQVKHYPALTPVMPRKRKRFRAKRSMLDEPLDSGPWRMARQPAQWVADHDLLLESKSDSAGQGKSKRRRVAHKEIIDPRTGLWNKDSPLWHGDKGAKRRRAMSLDHKRAIQLLTEQLGRTMPEDIHALADFEKALAAAFIRLAQGGGARSTEANAIFDAVSSTYDPDAAAIVTTKRVESDLEAILDEGMADPRIARITEIHGHFVTTWLMGLLYAGGENQSIPPSQFLWVRVVDRTLWYALHQVGSRCAWMEASGPWAHYWAENQIGRAIPEPQVDSAVQALDKVLHDEGWIKDPPRESPSANSKAKAGGATHDRSQRGRRERQPRRS